METCLVRIGKDKSLESGAAKNKSVNIIGDANLCTEKWKDADFIHVRVEGNPLKVSIKTKAVGAMATRSNDQLLF